MNKLKPALNKLTYGLGRRLMIVLSSIILLCTAAVLSISLFVQKQMIEERLNLNTMHLASLIKEVSTPAILRNDAASLEIFFEELEERADIVSVSLVDPEGWMWMSVDSDPRSWIEPVDDPFLARAIELGEPQQRLGERYLHRAGPIFVADEIIGYLNLRVARAPIEAELSDLWVSTVIIGIICLIVGPFLAWQVASRLSGPLLNLEAASRRVADGDFEHRVVCQQSNDEFDLVAASFNNMLDALQGSFLETRRVAYEDKLTGIPNRSWLNLQLDSLMNRPTTDGGFALLFLDVDRFKEVNDTHGHHIGDLLLRSFADRVAQCMLGLNLEQIGVRVQADKPLEIEKGEALFARLGGDEFTLLVNKADAEALANAITRAMKETFPLEGLRLPVSTSVGIALYPDHASSPDHLMKCADVAMYQAKQAARGSVAHYDEARHRVLMARNQMEKDIQKALYSNELKVFLQPKFDVANNTVSGAEALIRWKHPDRGFVPPGEFLPIAASMGLMPQIGGLMIDKAAGAAALINKGRSTRFSVAVNIASEELLSSEFASRMEGALRRHELDPDLLEVEITEGTAMEQSDLVEHNIDRLRELGVRLAIDDFGIGYSNLGRLKTMAFDTLKVDRSLLLDVVTDESAQSLFRTIIDMAGALHADVVAEGVETSEQLTFLRELGVKTYQGYFGAKPMPLDDFLGWVADQAGPCAVVDEASYSFKRAS